MYNKRVKKKSGKIGYCVTSRVEKVLVAVVSVGLRSGEALLRLF